MKTTKRAAARCIQLAKELGTRGYITLDKSDHDVEFPRNFVPVVF